MTKEKKKKSKIELINQIINTPALFIAGEAIKDLVVCYVVITILVNNQNIINLLNHTSLLLRLAIALGIMCVPVYYASKWLERIFKNEEESK